MKKRSFFERLTGSVNIDDDEILDLDEEAEHSSSGAGQNGISHGSIGARSNGSNSNASKFGPKSKTITFGGHGGSSHGSNHGDNSLSSTWMEDQAGEGELSLDVYQTPDEIIVRAMIPGVRKDDMDIAISRDTITIRGSRKEEKNISEEDYVVRELYWGTFSRAVRLPHEVDIEHAEATENQGLLTIKLPRVDKDKQAKLRIKSI